MSDEDIIDFIFQQAIIGMQNTVESQESYKKIREHITDQIRNATTFQKQILRYTMEKING